MIQSELNFQIAERAKKYIMIRGKGKATLSVVPHMHQGPGTVKITLEPTAKPGKPPEEDIADYRIMQVDGVELYIHNSVDQYAEANNVVLAYEDGFYYSGLVIKGLIKNPIK